MSISETDIQNATVEQYCLVAKVFYLLGKVSYSKGWSVVLQNIKQIVNHEDDIISAVNGSTKRIESARVLKKYSIETTKSENNKFFRDFPEYVEKKILEDGFVTAPVQKDGITYKKYNLRGNINGKSGTYEIGAKLFKTKKGNTMEKVTHRFFDPNGDRHMDITPEERKEFVKAFSSIDDVQLTSKQIKFRAAMSNIRDATIMGTGFSAVVNIPLLFRGEVVEFLKEVTIDSGKNALGAGLSEAFSPFMGEMAGPIGSAIVMSLIDVKNLSHNGDWHRFGKNMGKNGVMAFAGWACNC